MDEFEKVFRMKKELFIANDKGIIGGHYAVLIIICYTVFQSDKFL